MESNGIHMTLNKRGNYLGKVREIAKGEKDDLNDSGVGGQVRTKFNVTMKSIVGMLI